MHSVVILLNCEKEQARNDARWMQNQIRRESYIVKGGVFGLWQTINQPQQVFTHYNQRLGSIWCVNLGVRDPPPNPHPILHQDYKPYPP